MKTQSGYETNGDYIKFKCGFTGNYKVETAHSIVSFNNEEDANSFIITKLLGCEKGYVICQHYKKQTEGCYKCKFGRNSNTI